MEPPRTDVSFAGAVRPAWQVACSSRRWCWFEEWFWEKHRRREAAGTVAAALRSRVLIRHRERWGSLAPSRPFWSSIRSWRRALYAISQGYVMGGMVASSWPARRDRAVREAHQLSSMRSSSFNGALHARRFEGPRFHPRLARCPSRVPAGAGPARQQSQRIKHRCRVAYRLQRMRRSISVRAAASKSGRRPAGAQGHSDEADGHHGVQPRWRFGAKRKRS